MASIRDRGTTNGHRPCRRPSRHGLPRAHAYLLGLHQGHDRHDRAHRADPALPVVPRTLGLTALQHCCGRAPAGSQPREAPMVTIAVTAERDGEPRVAVSPETVKKLSAMGFLVKVQKGAGAASRFSDELLSAQGAEIASTAGEALGGADVFLKVRRPT